MLHCYIESQEFLGYGNGEHCQTYAEPTDLGEADHSAGQPASLTAETAVSQHVKCETGLCTDITECTGVSAQNDTTQDQCADKLSEVKACSHLLAYPHAC